MNSRDEASDRPGRNRKTPRSGQTRPPAPDTPELAERRAHAPAAQSLIKATRRLFAEGGPEWATDKRIHDTATRPGGRKGFPLGDDPLLLRRPRTTTRARRPLTSTSPSSTASAARCAP